MASLSLRNVYKRYPGGVTAVSDFNLEIKDKEFIILVGPSGCGKSTTLRMVAGLEEISEGEVYIGDRLVNDVAPKDRDIAMVFQNYALYPHMTVFDNMAFGLKLRKTPKDTSGTGKQHPQSAISHKKSSINNVSGVSALHESVPRLLYLISPKLKVFLLDEPLSNLDAKLRAQMRTEISKLHQRLGTTFIYVTHDQTEAMTMGTRIVVMKSGLIQQVDTPQNLYLYPCNLFVAGFIGSPQMNFIEAKLLKVGSDFFVEFGSEDTKTRAGVKYQIKLPADKNKNDCLVPYIDKEIIMGIRPENVHNEEDLIAANPDGIVEADVEVTELMGAETYLYMNCEGQSINARVAPTNTAKPADKIKIALEPSKIHLFDKDTEITICN